MIADERLIPIGLSVLAALAFFVGLSYFVNRPSKQSKRNF